MTTETKPNPAGAAEPVQPSAELVNGLLRWPEHLRLDLAHLRLESVHEGFTSLEEVEQRDKDMIRKRIEAFERDEIRATDWRESFARVERQFRAEFPQ